MNKHGKVSTKKDYGFENDPKNSFDFFKNLQERRQNGELRKKVIDRNILDANVIRWAWLKDDEHSREAMARDFIEELEESDVSDGCEIEEKEIEDVNEEKDLFTVPSPVIISISIR